MGGGSVRRSVLGIMGAALIAVLLLSCLKSGFYFTSDLYTAWMLYGLLPFFGGVTALLRRLAVSENEKRIAPAAVSAAERLLILSPFILMTVYALHWLLGPLSVHGTVNQLLRWGFYGLFAVSAVRIARSEGGEKVLASAWHAAGALLCGSALLAVCGILPLPHAVVFTSNAGISASGARLAGLVEYPNTFGLLMAAFLLERLFALAACSGGNPEQGRSGCCGLRSRCCRTPPRCSSASRARVAHGRCGRGRRPRPAAAAQLRAAAACGRALRRRGLLYRQLAAAALAVQPAPGLLALAGAWAGSCLPAWGFAASRAAGRLPAAAWPGRQAAFSRPRGWPRCF
ncbi:hypothetical protein CM49_04103 [Paenibacillus sp. P1XP2]|nr:hypothetical protein CM49_04103 [Paenibacillus sp. P1XP2]